MLARIIAVLLLILLPCSATARQDKPAPPPAPGPAPAVPPAKSDSDFSGPNFLFPYLVAALLSAGVIMVVCMPSRKG